MSDHNVLYSDEIKLMRQALAVFGAKIDVSIYKIQVNVPHVNKEYIIHPVYLELLQTRKIIENVLSKFPTVDDKTQCCLVHENPFSMDELITIEACLQEYKNVMKRSYVPKECPKFITDRAKDTLWIIKSALSKFTRAVVGV